MNTSTKPDAQNIEQLDFEPLCCAHIPSTAPTCQNSAAWVSVKRCGHVGLLCESCKAKTKPNDSPRCITCGRQWSTRSEAIIELRRL